MKARVTRFHIVAFIAVAAMWAASHWTVHIGWRIDLSEGAK